MKYLFDIVHPAHVHFFKHIVRALEDAGHQTCIVARDKDVTVELLNENNLKFTLIGKAGRKNRISQLFELVSRDIALIRIIREFGADVVLSRNPAGVQAAKVTGKIGIFDTDDGAVAGLHFYAAKPFANYITSPTSLNEHHGEKHIKYPGYKQSAYLHPDHYTPDPNIRNHLGLDSDEPYYLLRFVSMAASHDHNESGLSAQTKEALIDTLSKRGKLFITSESEIPPRWRQYELNLPSNKMHDVLAASSLMIGDSQTMAAEAAYLGVPNIRISSFVGRLACLESLEKEYQLMKSYLPIQHAEILNETERMLNSHETTASHQENRRRMLGQTVNVARWYLDFLTGVQ